MAPKDWILGLKLGDKVFIQRTYDGDLEERVINHKTPSGRVTLTNGSWGGRTFNASGNEVGQGAYGPQLVQWTPELAEAQALKEVHNKLITEVTCRFERQSRVAKYNIDQLQRILAIAQEVTNGTP